MSDYEVGIYNSRVRSVLRSGEPWQDPTISKDYESVLYFPICNSASIEETQRRVAKEWPPEQGFVLDYIKLITPEN